MKNAPYHRNPGNACALACYTMVAQYLFPEKDFTFKQFGEIANWKSGYVVWGFALWVWLMDQGMFMTNYDSINYEAWASHGIKGLKADISDEAFKFYKEGTYDLEAESKQVTKMYIHPHFTYIQKNPSWSDVVSEHNKPGICDVVLNSCALNKREGYALHRVVILDITESEVAFHDPNKDGSGEGRRESLSHFQTVFESIKDAELTRYYRK